MTNTPFDHTPGEHEAERASNSYLMSVAAVILGLPLPIVNLIATFIFYLGNRRSTYFVRWHCTQALLSQLSLLCMNSPALAWTLNILFTPVEISNAYIAYMITVVTFNIFEFFATIFTAVKVRKGVHVEWWFFGPLTQSLCKP